MSLILVSAARSDVFACAYRRCKICMTGELFGMLRILKVVLFFKVNECVKKRSQSERLPCDY